MEDVDMDINTDRTVSTSTWFAQVRSSVLIELGQIAGSGKCIRGGGGGGWPGYDNHINILRGLPCRLETLRLKLTNGPSIFVYGDLAESIKRSASDRLDDLVPQVRARASPRFSQHAASRPLSRNSFTCTILSYPGRPTPPLMHFAGAQPPPPRLDWG